MSPRYVAPCYDPGAPTPNPASIRRWASFFEAAGVRSTIAFECFADSEPSRADLKSFDGGKLPAIRSSNKQIPLPYGIRGELTKRRHLIVDARIQTTWAKIIRRALGAPDAESRRRAATAFATLLSRCNLFLVSYYIFINS